MGTVSQTAGWRALKKYQKMVAEVDLGEPRAPSRSQTIEMPRAEAKSRGDAIAAPIWQFVSKPALFQNS